MKNPASPAVRPLLPFALCAALAGSCLVAALRAQTPEPGPAATVSPTASPASPTPATTAKEDLLATAKSAGNFKTFLKAAEAAGLLDTLKKAGPYTAFIPTDAAFSKLPAGTLDNLLKPENKAKLVSLLSYHLANGRISAADLTKTEEIKTLEGTEIDVDVNPDGKTIELDEAKVLGSDLDCTNGIIHAIDTVLQPGNLF